MKKIISVVSALAVTGSLLAGGLVTNTNQSALYTRLQSRNASTGIDAVYYNPAGLTKLSDGFHLSLNNQTIGQTKTITTNYIYLNGNPKDYVGKVSAPFYPGIYAAFKTGKLALSLGFNPVGGGGGAEYAEGLAMFEMPISDLKPLLTGMGLVTTNYSVETLSFTGSSIYMGPQVNLSYQINDMLSVAAGLRVVFAKDKYEGAIENIMINPIHPLANPTGAMVSAPAFFTTIGQPVYAAKTSDTYADAIMKGTGYTPILSLNFSPIGDLLNVALKYEFKTNLDLKTTVYDGKTAGLFIQDSVAIKDMPAMLAFGVDVKPAERLLISGSLNYYFDKKVDYDGEPDVEEVRIDKNFIEAALGIQVGITERLFASAGWLTTITGVNDLFQSDLKYSLNTNTFGGGLGFKINDMIDINVGGSYTIYKEESETYTHVITKTPILVQAPAINTYNNKTWVAAIGLDFHF